MSVEALTTAVRSLAEGVAVDQDLAHAAALDLLSGSASETLATAYLTALRIRGESAVVLVGSVRAAREVMVAFRTPAARRPLLDTCGTGGDGARSFNVSTAAALVVAACGVPVAKHGNRSATGNCGSSDVLQAIGLQVDVSPETASDCLEQIGLAFLFAPVYHPRLRTLAGIRKQLPFRTLFNLVGPLANPARPERQLIGVAGPREAALVADALAALGVERGAVVTSEGLDEVALDGPTSVSWVEHGRIERRTWTRDDFGLPLVTSAELTIEGADDGAERIRALVAGQAGPIRSIALANSAAALLVAGAVGDLREGVARAAEAIDSGSAATLLAQWIERN